MADLDNKGKLTTSFNIGDRVAVDFLGRTETYVQEIVSHPQTGKPVLMLGDTPSDLYGYAPEDVELVAPATKAGLNAPKP